MKRVVRSLLLFFSTTLFMLSASVCVCVIRVHADGPTYTPLSGNGCEYAYISGTSISSRRHTYLSYNGLSNGRGVILYDGSLYKLAIVSESSFTGGTLQYTSVQSSCPTTSDSARQSNGYYLISTSFNVYQNNLFLDWPIVNTSETGDTAFIKYTFGEGAVDPVEPVNWGLVDVKGYQTNVAGQGQASINNVDVISWDSVIDTLGNDISTGNVRIRFLPGEYRSETKNNLLQQTYNDFILDIVHATDGNVFPVSNGSASFKWSDVISTLNIPFVSVYSLINENDAWLKRGWIYEIRLEINDYIGEWQPIYASTSSGVENDLTIVNTSYITQETITAIQNINSINSTTNIWIINGQPVDPNPEQEPPQDENEKPWWVYLLEMINNTLGIQNEYINEGTDESIEQVNNFEGDHTELNTTVNDYHDIENDLVIDMNNNLEQIEVDSDLIQNNSFISSARWVAEQYTRITTDNPIGSILKFSLVLGFVMIFLGRFRT